MPDHEDLEGSKGSGLSVPSQPTDPLAQMERRRVTVMFVDLVGSTLLSQEMDPEDLAAMTLRYGAIVRDIVGRFDGKITRFVGDGILVLFGWPTAIENAPESAVRSALEIHLALKKQPLMPFRDVQCHIGIATGLVVVGDVVESGTEQSDAIFGETPNLAARLQDLARPGETVISASTSALVDKVFECEALPDSELADASEGFTAFLIRSERMAAHRFAGITRTEIVGRSGHLQRLNRLWETALSGQGQMVLLSGEAGVGKSRLLFEQRRQSAYSGHALMVFQCSPFHEGSAYYPFSRYVEVQAGVLASDTSEARQQKVSDRFRDVIPAAEIDMLNALVTPGRQNKAEFEAATEEEILERLLKVFAALIRTLSRTVPVLIHFEDAHWIDPSSRGLLRSLPEVIADLPVLGIVTHRSETPMEDLSGLNVQRIGLDKLSREHARKLILAIDEADVLSPEAVDQILAATNGLPLFLEHCAAAACAQGGHNVRDDSVIPERLYDLLLHHLEMPDDMKRVALTGAALAQSFDAEIIAGILGQPVETVEETLRALVQRQVLASEQATAGVNYVFRHALVQTAAYNSLVKSRRIKLHRQIAEHLVTSRPDYVERVPELIAQHYEKCEDVPRAVKFWTVASLKSLRQVANREADRHALNGLALLDKLPEDQRAKRELDLQSLRAAALRAYKGYGAPENMKAMTRTFELSEQLGERDALLRSGHGLFTVYQVAGAFEAAGAVGRRIADRVEDNHGQMIAHYIMGVPLTWCGRFIEAHRTLIQAEAFGTAHLAEEHIDIADTAGQIQIGIMLGLVEAFLGIDDFGVARVVAGVEAANTSGRPLTMANAAHIASHALQMIRHPNTIRYVEMLIEVSEQSGYPFYTAGAMCLRGGALAIAGEWSEALRHILKGYEGLQATGSLASGPYVMTEMAEIRRQLGDFDLGLEAVAKGLKLVERFDERNFEAELHRVKGLILSDAGEDGADSEAALSEALRIARRQSALLFALRAATDLAERGRDETVRATARNVVLNLLADMPKAGGPDIERAKKFAF